MCGLVGAVGGSDVLPALLQSLARVEHRDHDSVGLGFVDGDGVLGTRRCVGKLGALQEKIRQAPLACTAAIGHSRWATHGAAELRNVHPQVSKKTIAVVHNGLVENHAGLREALRGEGYAFESDTDSEVIAHLVHRYRRLQHALPEALRLAARHLQGPYAIAAIEGGQGGHLVAACHGSPLLIGVATGARYLASAATALLPLTRELIFLEDGDVVAMTPIAVAVMDRDGRAVRRPVEQLWLDGADAEAPRHPGVPARTMPWHARRRAHKLSARPAPLAGQRP